MLSETKKKQAKKKSPKSSRINKVGDFGNDPFFIKKAEESKAFLEKNGFPKQLLTRK
jgi:hypothetical protein